MKNAEDLFRESILQYQQLITDIANLNDSMAALTPETIFKRCEALQKSQSNQSKIDKFIVEIMGDIGHQILKEPYVHEYQQLINIARISCDKVAAKAVAIRDELENEL